MKYKIYLKLTNKITSNHCENASRWVYRVYTSAPGSAAELWKFLSHEVLKQEASKLDHAKKLK